MNWQITNVAVLAAMTTIIVLLPGAEKLWSLLPMLLAIIPREKDDKDKTP